MGGPCLLNPHPLLHFSSFSSFTPPTFRNSPFRVKEISNRSSVLSIRADGKKGGHKKNPYPGPGRAPTEGLDGNAQSFDGKSPPSPNKEEILALFKRIQSSISKGETVSAKKMASKTAEDKPSSSTSAEPILEVLRQSRTQRKGKSVGKKGDKLAYTQKEDSAEHVSSTRLPSRFSKKSPIRSLSSPREELKSENEEILTIPSDETEARNEISPSTDYNNDEQTVKLEEMKLPQLKEVAKSKGIKGYSKLKKSELVELLIKSLNDDSS